MNNCDAYSPSSQSSSSITSTSTSPRGRALVQMFEIVTASNWTGSYQKKNNSNSNLKSSNSKSSNKNRNRMIVSDLRPLLLLMDIGSCASAEKHCKVNCVTASMGDVVIENYPIVGDLLELQASPVSVGRTSLEISVVILAHCNSDSDSDSEDSSDSNDEEHDGEDAKDNDEHSNGSPSSFVQTKTTRRVCEAFFTYVTTRGPNGEKRYVPPLEEEEKKNGNVVTVSSSSSTIQQKQKQQQEIYICKLKWERTLAYFRKELIKSEQQLVKTFNSTSTSTSNCQSNTPNDIFEMSEVVLPSNQNHMKHLFGGVVMGWMCKSVIAGCVKATCLSTNKFHITAIHRVDFPTGAEVSDHVFFRPRITAIFEQGRSAEFEVKVGKRNITPMIHGQSNNNGADDVLYDDHDETLMNIGHFYVSGSLSYVDDENKKKKKKNKKLSSSIAPFAKLLNTHKHLYSNDSIHNRLERNMAYQRRKSLLARRHLLAGLGESLQWDSSCLKIQAPILTILSVLRLCDEYESTNANSSSADDDDANGDASYYQEEGRVWKVVDLEGSLGHDHDHVIEWTPGNVDTVLLRGKTLISRKRLCQNKNDIVDESESEKSSSSSLSASSSFLEAVYTTLRDKRLQWDPACMSVTLLEDNRNDDNDDNAEVEDDKKTKHNGTSTLKPDWDIVEYKMQTPNAQTKFCLLRVGAYVNDANSVSDSNNRNNSDNNKVTSGVLASRSVIHDKSDAKNRVLPSGWLLKMIDSNNNCHNDDNNDQEFIEITYIAEQDFAKIRDTGVGGNKDVTDEYLAKLYGSYVSQWFTNLDSFDHTSAH